MTELVMRSSNGDHRAARDFDEFEVEAEVTNDIIDNAKAAAEL